MPTKTRQQGLRRPRIDPRVLNDRINALPKYLAVPLPIPDPRPRRGIHAHGEMSIAYSVRFSPAALDHVQIAAELIGLSAGEFIRWVSEYSADVLVKLVDEIEREKANEEANK